MTAFISRRELLLRSREQVLRLAKTEGTTTRHHKPSGLSRPEQANVEIHSTKPPQVNQAAIVENKRLGPILAYIAEQQKKLDMSRSAKAPRRRGQKNHMFKIG